MTVAICHRDPNDRDSWFDSDSGIGFSHRQLVIPSASQLEHHSLRSPRGRFVISYSGGLHNPLDMRRDLAGANGTSTPAFLRQSDSEVLLAAIEQWGLEEALRRSIGTSAFALWDRRERVLHLVRDRLGEKSLYYGWAGGAFLFSSGLKALRAHPDFRGEVDRDALALYMRHNCIPAPYSIYRGIRKLLPGTMLSITPGAQPGTLPDPIPYWSAREVAEAGCADPFSGSEEEAADRLDALLRDAVARRMITDVPFGAFLSGGIDSTTIVALMQAQSDRPVKSFTIGFHESDYNEAEQAREIAAHLGLDHTEWYVTPAEAQAVIPELPSLYDEPFADSSQIPMALVAQLARRHVSICLSGDGGDELFGGYNRHTWGPSLWKRLRRVPKSARRLAARGTRALSPHQWDRAFRALGPVLPPRFRQRHPGGKLHKLADLLVVDDPPSMYRAMVSHWSTPESIVLGASEPSTAISDPNAWSRIADFSQSMMYLDLVSYLPDDILVKVDRACMGAGLKSRIPMLDHRVVEFAWKIPLSMKIRDGRGKWLLREVLSRYVPPALTERPKTGFGVPIGSWLRGPLRDWAEALLDENRLHSEGFFDPAPIRHKWTEHLSGRRNWQHHLWDVLMFQAWLEAQ